MFDFPASVMTELVGKAKIRNGMTGGLDTKSWEVSQGGDQIPNLKSREQGARGQEAQ